MAGPQRNKTKTGKPGGYKTQQGKHPNTAPNRKPKKEKKPVVTFTDKVLKAVWMSIGGIGMTGLFLLAIYAKNMTLMLPGACILMAIGVYITGAILDDRSLKIRTFSALLLIMMASCHIVFMKDDFYWYYITFSLGFIVMLVMPGYHLNKEAKKHVQRT